MTPLRQQMIDAMLMRGMSPRTHRCYLMAVTELAKYFHRSPDQLSGEELQTFFLSLVKERHLAPASCRLYLNAIRYFYRQVLGRESFDVKLHVPKQEQRIPKLLMRSEVSRFLAAPANLKHRMLLTTCYGCGLRVSELVSVQVRHLDSEQRLLRVEQGKGAKDRAVILSPTLLRLLRDYWRERRPVQWLFLGMNKDVPLSIASVQKLFHTAKQSHGAGWRRTDPALSVTHFADRLYADLPLRLSGQPLLATEARANPTKSASPTRASRGQSGTHQVSEQRRRTR